MKEQQRTSTVRANGVELHYVEAGEGQPVVMVHGSLSDFRTWSLQRKFFSRRYRVVTYSRRYHFPNDHPKEPADYSALLHAGDLAALIHALRLGSVHLIGSSYGAYISLLMAARHPELVRTLVVGEPPLFPLLKRDREGASLLRRFLRTTWEPSRKALQENDVERGVRTFYDGIDAAGSFDRLSPSVRAGMLENAFSMRAEAISRSGFPAFTKKDALRIRVPCLLLNGELSPRLFHRITDLLEQRLPLTERMVVPRASHSMHSHNPRKYNEIVLRFLEKADPGEACWNAGSAPQNGSIAARE
jgi:pimeloyl-ACP methyl ester carboxylesterase